MSLDTTLEQVKESVTNAGESIDATVKFDFGDEGTIFLDGNSSPNEVSTEDKEADCTVTIALEDFKSMLAGDLNPMNAFMEQKMTIDGDMSIAMKLSSIFG